MPELNGSDGDSPRRRLDQMQDTIQSMITLAHEQQKSIELMLTHVKESRAEIQDLLELQKEHRVDIMALFVSSKEIRDLFLQKLKESGPKE